MKLLFRGAVASLALPFAIGVAQAEGCPGMPSPSVMLADPGPLTLEGAVARAGDSSPEVLRAALEARAMSADADQVGRFINPSISLEAENFAGSGPLRGFSAYETTLSLEQTFRLGSKRKLSELVARADAVRAVAECRILRREVQGFAGELFLELRAAIDMADVAVASAELAEELERIVARRVEAGASAPPELSRAKADALLLRAIADKAHGEVTALALALASVWGSSTVDFELPVHSRGLPKIQPAEERVIIAEHPQIRVARADETVRRAVTERSRAEAWPDIMVSAG